MSFPFDVPLAELRERTSAKWRAYPADVLPLFVAEMDVRPAEPVRRAVADALTSGDTGYEWGRGYGEAFAELAESRYGWVVDVAATVTVSDVMRGAVEVLRLLTDPGDAVVINPPVYPPFTGFVELADRRVLTAPLGVDGRLDLEALEAAFALATTGGRRAAYLLCHPHNPTGTLHTADELRAVGALGDRYGVRVVADEIHAPLVLDGTFVPTTTVIPDAIALHSASKAFNLAGLGCAVAVAGPDARADLARMPELVGHGVPHVAATAHRAAFREGGEWLDALLAALRENADHLDRLIADRLPGAVWHRMGATYFAWLDLRALAGELDPARSILRDGRVALNPGPTFGPQGAGFARLNFATSPAILDEAVRRMATALAPRGGVVDASV